MHINFPLIPSTLTFEPPRCPAHSPALPPKLIVHTCAIIFFDRPHISWSTPSFRHNLILHFAQSFLAVPPRFPSTLTYTAVLSIISNPLFGTAQSIPTFKLLRGHPMIEISRDMTGLDWIGQHTTMRGSMSMATGDVMGVQEACVRGFVWASSQSPRLQGGLFPIEDRYCRASSDCKSSVS